MSSCRATNGNAFPIRHATRRALQHPRGSYHCAFCVGMRGVPDAGSARETLARVAAYTGIGDPATITEEDDGSITLSDGDRVVAVARPEVTS